MGYSTEKEILQPVLDHGMEGMSEVLQKLFNLAMKLEHEYAGKTSEFAKWLEYEIPEGLTVFNLAPDSIWVRSKLRTTNMVEFQNKELKKTDKMY
jgi:hypothetical protein